MFERFKLKLRKNKTFFYLANLFRYFGNEDFQNLVRGFRGADIVVVDHLGDLHPNALVYKVVLGNTSGFWWEITSALHYLYYASKYNLTPVVQWSDSRFYKEAESVDGTNNIFEYYFLPASEITVSDISKCKNVVYRNENQALGFTENEWVKDGYRMRMKWIERYGGVYRKYCKLNQKTQLIIDKNIMRLLSGKRTLGLHVRGTDFKNGLNDHPVYISTADFIKPARAFMEKYGYEQIFLATDTVEALKVFSKEFGSSLVYYDDVFRSDGDIGVHYMEDCRENHHYLLGLEVLRDAYTLAACDSLIAGMSNVSLAAQYIKYAEGSVYNEVKILDHGINHNSNRVN